jgi:hypothetical protein
MRRCIAVQRYGCGAIPWLLIAFEECLGGIDIALGV